VENKNNEKSMEEKLTAFTESCDNTNTIPKFFISTLESTLRVNNLFKIAIKGTPEFRFDDLSITTLVESIIKADILLVDLSLTYHRINGFHIN